MNEDFLQYIWKHRLFRQENLQTTQGESIEIVNIGMKNSDSGPDFFNASIRIGSTLWAGNIEIHQRSSDWERHGHQTDAAYNNVILHVVYENDKAPTLPNGNPLPVLEIVPDKRALDNYDELLKAPDWPACSHYIQHINPIYIATTFNSVVVERLHTKSQAILHILHETQNDWNETFYRFLARGFGFKTNALPFELMAKFTPLKVLGKHKKNLFQTEAIIFGQSGLLNEQLLGDDYFIELRNEYAFWAEKYQLKGIESHLWKFMRLRPASFPTLRLAQFAHLINRSESLLSKIIETESPQIIKSFFDVQASAYWDHHYRFNTPSKKRTKHMGEAAQNHMIINTIAPFLFIYGDHTNKNDIKNRALELLEALEPESNAIINRWTALNIEAKNSFDTQAMIQLKNNYCEPKKCLKCQLGMQVIKNKVSKQQ